MNHRRPPLKDIMRLTGLSRATVDRVLNGRGGVHARTQTAVDAAIAQLVCDDNRQGQTSPEVLPSAARKSSRLYRIVIQAGDAFTQSIVEEAGRLAPQIAARGCRLEVITCVGMANELVAERIRQQVDADGVVLIAKSSAAINVAASELRAQGKAVITSHTDLERGARHAYVGIDNRAAGQTAGFLMGRHITQHAGANSAADVAVVVETLAYQCHEEREMGFRSVLRQRFPSLNLIEVVKCDDTGPGTYAAINALLEKWPTIDGIYNTAGGNQGVAQALAEHGRRDTTLFVTHEYNAVTEALIRSDQLDYLITQNLKHMLLEATDQLSAILDGVDYRAQVIIPLEILCRYSLPPTPAELRVSSAL